MIQATLLRDIPEERRMSMERYADDLEHGFEGHPDVRVRGFSVGRPTGPAPRPLRRAAALHTRLIRYPQVAKTCPGDVFHVIDHGYADLVRALPPERTVVTCHDLILLRAEEGAVGPFRGRRATVTRFRWSVDFLKRVARVVCVSAATQRDVIRLLGVDPKRTEVVHSGVDPRFRVIEAERAGGVRAELGGGEHRLVLSVSTGNPYKNLEGVLRAFAAARRSGLQAKLVCCGRPLTDDQRHLARGLEIDGDIVTPGVVSDTRLVEIYNACDALLFPSYIEGFGWPVLEAMACGLPAVTSTDPALAEVGGPVSLRASATDHEALARKLVDLLGDPAQHARLRAAGLERAAEFTWERAIGQIADIYRDVTEA